MTVRDCCNILLQMDRQPRRSQRPDYDADRETARRKLINEHRNASRSVECTQHNRQSIHVETAVKCYSCAAQQLVKPGLSSHQNSETAFAFRAVTNLVESSSSGASAHRFEHAQTQYRRHSKSARQYGQWCPWGRHLPSTACRPAASKAGAQSEIQNELQRQGSGRY